MKKTPALLGALALALSITGGIAAAGPASPLLLSSDPEEDAVLTTAPAEVTLTFSQLLDAAYSRVEVYACGTRVSSADRTVTLNEISTSIEKAYRGKYKVFYFANGTPKGATGETTGTLTFNVKKGPSCK